MLSNVNILMKLYTSYHAHGYPALQHAERMLDTVYRSNTTPQQVAVEKIAFLSEARNLLRRYAPFGGKGEAAATLLQGNHLEQFLGQFDPHPGEDLFR